MRGYKSHIQPVEYEEAYMYPLHLIKEQEYECVHCEYWFYPQYTYDEEITESNPAMRRDTITFSTNCPYCDTKNVNGYRYYYD